MFAALHSPIIFAIPSALYNTISALVFKLLYFTIFSTPIKPKGYFTNITEVEQALEAKSISLHVDEPSVDLLLKKGFDKKMGARPVARTVDKLLRVPISKELVVDPSIKGCKIKVRVDKDNLLLKIIRNHKNEPESIKQISVTT